MKHCAPGWLCCALLGALLGSNLVKLPRPQTHRRSAPRCFAASRTRRAGQGQLRPRWRGQGACRSVPRNSVWQQWHEPCWRPLSLAPMCGWRRSLTCDGGPPPLSRRPPPPLQVDSSAASQNPSGRPGVTEFPGMHARDLSREGWVAVAVRLPPSHSRGCSEADRAPARRQCAPSCVRTAWELSVNSVGLLPQNFEFTVSLCDMSTCAACSIRWQGVMGRMPGRRRGRRRRHPGTPGPTGGQCCKSWGRPSLETLLEDIELAWPSSNHYSQPHSSQCRTCSGGNENAAGTGAVRGEFGLLVAIIANWTGGWGGRRHGQERGKVHRLHWGRGTTSPPSPTPHDRPHPRR